MSREVVFSPTPRSLSGVVEVDRLTAAVPLLLARTAALLLAREAVRAAFAFRVASGLALYTWTRATGVADDGCMLSGGDKSGGEVDVVLSAVIASPIVGVAEGR